MKLKGKGLIWKILAGIIVLFLVMVAVKDWTPTQTTVEKTVTYENR